jgi:hypothetical protein
MRLIAAAALFVGGLSAPTPAPDAICTVTDARAHELSGLIVTADGFVAINDSNDVPSDIRIFYLDDRCQVRAVQSYPTPARDPEDVALAPDGSVWVADTGDNVTSQNRRSTIALWQVPTGGRPAIHRLTYPDGPHDAEALLMTADGTPVIVTKELAGPARLFEPVGPLTGSSPVRLKEVGRFQPTATGVSNPLGTFGENMVTGASVTSDRRRVALRTYSAAYEWSAPDGDVVAAITRGTPVVEPLPDEPQGEAIAYAADGASFYTLSDEAGPTTIRRYRAASLASPSKSPAAGALMGVERGFPWYPAGLAALGALLMLALGWRLIKSRRS